MSARSVVFDIIGHDSASKAFLSASKAADQAATRTDAAIHRMNAAGARMQAVGQRMSKAITLPVVAAAGVAVHEAVKFEKSMTLLQTAGGETARKMTVISGGIKKVAADTGTSLDHLAEGMYTIAKAGAKQWSATDQLLVLKAAAQGAKAENVDLATATNALTSVMTSYGMKASDAVAAENMLIKGSGLAKTTFQDFAGSLSSVLPLASSLHIKFSEVAGAMATLTQHGESAQRATDNLNNLITSLAGQNNVAAQAMGQLNINTVDLQKNLGKRGLSGTLAIVEDALAKQSHGGMVVVSAFKRAQIATQSLHTEIAAMPAPLAKMSDQLLRGEITRGQYAKSIKGMTLDQYTLGRNFLATANVAMGFNNILKAGKGDTLTAATALQKMLGGVTGMRAALMLGGSSAKLFASNVADVAAAARKGGVDVLGWAETSNTLAVKMDKAKANLQVLAVEVGTALIPAVTKLVGWITGAVKWFDGLSSGAKKFIGYTVLVVAALGPVMAIAGRVTRAIAFMWGTGVAVGRFIAGVRGAELAIGAMSSKSYLAGLRIRSGMMTGVGGVRSLGAALGGAGIGVGIGLLTRNSSTATKAIGALGSAAGGAALGFAVGGPWGAAIGGGVGLLSNLATSFFGAGSSAKGAVKATDDFTDAMLRDNSAVGANTRALIENKLQKSGAYDAALKLGIGQKLLTQAAMGQTGALTEVNARLGAVRASTLTAYGMSNKQAAAMENQRAAAQKLNGVLGDTAATLKANKQAATNLAAAEGKQLGATNALTGAHRGARGAILGSASAAEHASTSFGGTGLSAQQTAGILRGLQAISGETGNALAGLATPHPVDVDTSAAMAKLSALNAEINSLASAGSLSARGSANKQAGMAAGRASGGGAPEGWFAVGEAGPELAHKRGSVVEIFSNAASKAILATSGMKAPGFAAGTKKTYTVGSTKYTSKLAADNARSRQDQSLLQGLVSGIAGLLAQAHSTHSTAADLSNAGKTLYHAAKEFKASAGELKTLASNEKALVTLGQARDRVMARLGTAPTRATAYDKLAAAKSAYYDTRSTVRSAVGAFDITQAGVSQQVYNDVPVAPVSAGSILAELTATAAKAKTFARLLRTLSKNGLPKSLLMQLASAGPAAMDQAHALAVATPKQIAAISGQYHDLATSGNYAGTLLANDLKRAGVQSAQGLVNGLLSQESKLNKAIKKLGDSMVHQLKRTLGIKSPSTVTHSIGVNLGRGLEIGMASRAPHVEAQANRMAHKAIPNAAMPSRGGIEGGVTVNVYPAPGMDEVAVGAVAARRLAALVY